MIQIRSIKENVYAIDVLPEITPFLTTYIIIDDYPAIVDCGPKRSIRHLLDALNVLRIDPKEIRFILLSHIHIDHAGGVGTLLKYLPNACVVVHPKGTHIWFLHIFYGEKQRKFSETPRYSMEK